VASTTSSTTGNWVPFGGDYPYAAYGYGDSVKFYIKFYYNTSSTPTEAYFRAEFNHPTAKTGAYTDFFFLYFPAGAEITSSNILHNGGDGTSTAYNYQRVIPGNVYFKVPKSIDAKTVTIPEFWICNQGRQFSPVNKFRVDAFEKGGTRTQYCTKYTSKSSSNPGERKLPEYTNAPVIEKLDKPTILNARQINNNLHIEYKLPNDYQNGNATNKLTKAYVYWSLSGNIESAGNMMALSTDKKDRQSSVDIKIPFYNGKDEKETPIAFSISVQGEYYAPVNATPKTVDCKYYIPPTLMSGGKLYVGDNEGNELSGNIIATPDAHYWYYPNEASKGNGNSPVSYKHSLYIITYDKESLEIEPQTTYITSITQEESVSLIDVSKVLEDISSQPLDPGKFIQFKSEVWTKWPDENGNLVEYRSDKYSTAVSNMIEIVPGGPIIIKLSKDKIIHGIPYVKHTTNSEDEVDGGVWSLGTDVYIKTKNNKWEHSVE